MKKVTSLFAIIFILLIVSPTTYAANWKWIYSSDTTGYYLDTKNIHKEQTSTFIKFKVWTKQIFNEDGIKEQINRRIKANMSVEGYENLSYRVSHEEYKYEPSTSYYRTLSYIDYNDEGKVLYSNFYKYKEYDERDGWEEIFPDTIGKGMLDAIIIYYAIESDNK